MIHVHMQNHNSIYSDVLWCTTALAFVRKMNSKKFRTACSHGQAHLFHLPILLHDSWLSLVFVTCITYFSFPRSRKSQEISFKADASIEESSAVIGLLKDCHFFPKKSRTVCQKSLAAKGFLRFLQIWLN